MSDLSMQTQLVTGPGVSTVTTQSLRLVKAAHEFEAAMMKELLAPMTPGHDSMGTEEEAGSSSALNDFAGEALGKAISESGGFGIAKSILHQLSHPAAAQSNHQPNPQVPATSPVDTVTARFQ